MIMEKIEIPQSRIKLSFVILGALCFVIVSVCFIFYAETIAPRTILISRSILVPIIFGVGVLGVVTFGYFFCIGVNMLLTNPMGLIIDQKGITLPHSGLIEWLDIRHIDMQIISNNKIIFIYLNNPQQYIQRLKRLNQSWAKMTLRFYQTPISISAKSLQCSDDELLQLLQNKFKQYGADS